MSKPRAGIICKLCRRPLWDCRCKKVRAKETEMRKPECCADWLVLIEKVNGPIVLQSIRAGRDLYKETGGKPFKYCPWCGKVRPK